MHSKAALLMLKGVVTELPQEQQETIAKAVAHIRDFVKETGEEGVIALSLIALELAAAQEE